MKQYGMFTRQRCEGDEEDKRKVGKCSLGDDLNLSD
jgi:hypothetical protein